MSVNTFHQPTNRNYYFTEGKCTKTVDFDKSKEWIVSTSANRAFSLASTPNLPNTAANGAKEKFNFVEEFFVCLACIFD